MKKITLLILLLFATFIGNSQTALTAGDIAFVGSNSDGATNADDTVAFVLLKDIDAATTIIFTDMGWNDGTGFFATNGDGEFTWTSGVARTAGEVVTINMGPLAPAAYSFIGDQLFAIQGSTAAPTFIAGLQYNDTSGDDSNWDGSATSNSTSALPNALVTGSTAIRLVPESDNWQFSCVLAGGAVSGTPAQIRAIVNDRANWVSSDTTPYNPALEAGCGFTISGGGDTTPPVITCAPTPAPITAGINGMAAIPDLVSGTSATDDISIPANITITQSPTAGTMVGVGVYNVVLTATDEAGNNATCTIVVTINEPPFTTLNPGDIAFVGFNLDGNDGFAFILLKDIIAGTNIKFTDCGVSNPNTITCVGSGGEGSATWYASSAMSAGDIVTLPGSFMSASILASIGDQLFAYQGTAASPNFITAIHSNVDPGVTTDGDWDGANTSNSTTALPDQLTNGVNAIRLYVAGTPDTEVDNWQFDCSAVPGGFPISGSPAQLAAIINDIQYWINNDTTEFVPTAKAGCSYDVGASFTALADLCIDAGEQTGLGGGTPTGGVYSGPGVTDDGNGMTYSFDPATAGVGTHTLTYTESGDSATDDVEVFALDDASFNYAAASYCENAADPTPTITGLGGGTFTSAPVGLSINASTGAIDVSASTPGTYTVTYTTAGTCPNSSGVSVTINAVDDASFNYGAASYCVNAADPTPTITGLGGGTFSSAPAGLSLNASTGAIDVSASTPGTYTVTYTTAGTCPNSSGVSVTINTLDNASFNYGAASYCVSSADPTPTITGLGGGTFSSAPAGLSINASTGAIDVSASTSGTYTVTYTTAGACPNSSGVSVTINALDDASFNYGAASYCVSAADPTPTITGLGGGNFSSAPAGISINASTGTIDVSASTPGTYTVTYTTAGTCPNSSSVSVTINALDDASFNYDAAAYCADASDPTPTITGVGGGTFSSGAGLSINASTGTIDLSTSTPATYTVTYTTTGTCSNSSSVSVTVNALPTVTFIAPPSPICPGELLSGQGGGAPTGGVYSGPGVTDDGNGMTYTFDAGAAGNGTHTLLYTYSDANGCTNSASDDVTVEDITPPEIICPGDIVVDNDLGFCGADVTYADPTVTDNCSTLGGTVTFSYTGSPQTFTVPPGITSLSIEAWGAAGQDFTVEQYTPSTGGLGGYASGDLTVTPGDIITIYVGGAGADNIGGYNGGGLGGFGTPSDGSAGRAGSGGGASDIRIGTATLADRVLVAGGGGGGGRDYVNGSCQPCGMGGNGGAGGALIGIDGEDPTDPIYGSYLNPGASGKGGTQANGGAGGNGPEGPDGMPGTLGVGGIGIDGSYSIASGGGGGGYYGGGSGAGTNPGSGAAGAGGAGGSSYIGGVNNGTTTPAIRSGAGEVIITIPSSLTLTQTAGLPSGSTFPVGTTTNTFVVTDASGNTATCSFDVTVNDTEAPEITCPGNITQDNDPGICGAVITYTAPVGTDNCSGATTTQTAGLASGETFPVGITTNTFVVTDASGNTATCSFDVTINDIEAPIANCAAPFTVQLDANGMVSITVGDIDNGSTDNCVIASTSIDVTDFTCADVGDNNVTLTVTDVNGNSSTCTTVVTVEDNVAPVANCAAPFTIQLDANGMASITVADIENGSTDACGIASTTIDITDFDCSDVGPNMVTLTVTDVNGNTSTCTTIVTVEDSIPPAITCPADITVNTDLGNCSAIVNFPMPITSDNCGVATVVQTMGDPSGSMFPVGATTIEFTATDVNGNTNTCSFIITVVDNEAPVAVCQNITIQLDAAGNASIVAADVDGGSTDQCGVANISIDIDTFDCSNVGDNNVILTVTDVNGNVSTCTAIVTVEDVTAPVVACQNITVELDPVTGTVTILGTDIDNGSTDACGIASYDLDIDTFDCSNIGDNTVVLTVTDVNGNSETCTAIVTVEDNTSPVLVCQDFTIEIGADGTATLSPSDVIASNDDACGILTVAVDITAFSCADIGTPVTVQVFSQDNNGNLSTCTAVVTAVDLLAPVITCPTDQTVDPGAGNLFYIVPDYFGTGEATAIDNCTDPVTITTQDPAAGTTLSDGTYTIALTATDAYGNTSTCEFELIVESVLGTGDHNQDLGSIAMYPVPTKNTLNISNPQGIDLQTLEIYDLRGRLVQRADLKGMGTIKPIDVQQLAAATYYVKIIGKDGQITKRLLKE